MVVDESPEDVCDLFFAYVVSPDDPHGEVIENSSFLVGARQDNKIRFDGELNVRDRVGKYELRITVKDIGKGKNEVEYCVYKQPIQVAKK